LAGLIRLSLLFHEQASCHAKKLDGIIEFVLIVQACGCVIEAIAQGVSGV
jgi:hypothetical protein